MPAPSSTSTDFVGPLIAAVGALLVACVAGGFSLLGLIISKEQKVSEFRQAWIDALRADLADLVARAYQIQSFVIIHRHLQTNASDRWKETREDYVALNQASTRIKLRLNPEECESKLVLGSMSRMEDLLKDIKDEASSKKIDEIVDALERDAPVLLKKEWNRVKGGEPIYWWSRVLAFSIFLLAGIAVAVVLRRLH